MLRETRVKDLLDTAERHARRGHRVRAVTFYRKVLALTQDGEFERELAHARIARLHLALREPARAVPHLRRALALSAGEPEYALMLGSALAGLPDRSPEQLAEAMSHLHDAARSATWAAAALGALARATDAAGDRRAAGQLARRAAERDPTDPALRTLVRDLADA